MTLRLRLLLLLVGLVAAGLVISDIATYRALDSFLTTRVDQQLQGASFPVGRALFSQAGLTPSGPAPGRPSTSAGDTGTSVPGGATAPATPGTPRHHPEGVFRSGGALGSSGAGRDVLVPPGTYGQLRSSTGRVEAHIFFSYGGRAPSPPVLPAALPGSGAFTGTDRYFTAPSRDGSVQYRAVARALGDRTGTVVIAIPLSDVSVTLDRLLVIELVVSALVLVGLGVLSWVMVRRDLRPLDEMTETAGIIARGDLSQRVTEVSERTEVGKLGRAFNTMVDEIEVAFGERRASEDRLRRFLADASHELRTPLTSIQGYAELFDLGVADRPADLARSMRAIKGEAARMGTLVDDLFLLAQLDRPRPLRFGPVDLGELVQRSVDSLTVAAPGRQVVLTVEPGAEVVGDEARLRQVVDNLLVNADAYSPSDRPVTVTLAVDGANAVLTVQDEGPGIDPGEADRIFEPFYRSDPSRARSSGGAGLGLAIAAAIVNAHQGTIEVRSEPGRGAIFECRIPRSPPSADPPPAVPGHPEADAGDPAPDREVPSAVPSIL